MRFFYRAGGAILIAGIIGISAAAQPAGGSDRQRELARLKTALQEAEQRTEAVGRRLPPLDLEVEKLRDKIKRIEPPKAAPIQKSKEEIAGPPTQAGGPAVAPRPKKKDELPEEWHLPLSRESNKKTNLIVVCDGGRISLADFEALTEAVKKDDGRILRNNGTYILSGGDFDVQVTSTAIQCVRKAGRIGESFEQARSPDSALQKRLNALSPADNDLFLATRKLAFDLKYDLGWMPVSVGKKITIGGGKASSQ
jgi:hypothetical protein